MQPIYWHEGMFLEPHHFQQQDAFHQEQLRRLTGLERASSWGVVNLDVDREQVGSGVLSIDSGAFLFPDGTWVSVPENADPVSLDLTGTRPESGEGIVWLVLALPRIRPGQSNVLERGTAAPVQTSDVRYTVDLEGDHLADRYTGERDRPILRVRYLLRLVTEEAAAGLRLDHDLIRVAAIEWRAGTPTLSKALFPPLANLAASRAAVAWVRNCADRLLAAARRLKAHFTATRYADHRVEDIAARHFGVIDCLIQCASRLSNWVAVPTTHPACIHAELRTLVQRLAAYSSHYDLNGSGRLLPDGIPAYRHEDPSASLHSLSNAIDDLLDEVAQVREHRVALHRTDDAYFEAELPAGYLSGANLYLAIRTSWACEQWLPGLLRDAKAGTPEGVDQCLRRALPGLALVSVSDDVVGLTMHPGVHYIELEREGADWLRVVETRRFAIIWPDAPSDVLIEIVMEAA